MLTSNEMILRELREQTKWLAFLAKIELRKVVDVSLVSAAERRAFDASDGSRSTRDVAGEVGVSQPTISRWWSRWQALGIVTVDERGRANRLASLYELGLRAQSPATDSRSDTNDE